MDVPVTAEAVTAAGGSASVITYLGEGKNTLHSIFKKGMRIYEQKTPADTKVKIGGGSGEAPGTGVGIPCSPVKTMVIQVISLQPMKVPN